MATTIAFLSGEYYKALDDKYSDKKVYGFEKTEKFEIVMTKINELKNQLKK
ncbi:hypothetical protein HYH44_06335 [Clostridium botulinum]|nr:hypothetical protein [Clostridium botulinum]